MAKSSSSQTRGSQKASDTSEAPKTKPKSESKIKQEEIQEKQAGEDTLTRTRYLKGEKKPAKTGEKPKSKPKEKSLKKIEEELNQREVALIEREIKTIRLQEELDRLRPLSGLYRVVKSMATERKLDPLLETITRETQSMLKADRCSVFVVEQDGEGEVELWTKVAQGLDGSKTIRIPMDGTFKYKTVNGATLTAFRSDERIKENIVAMQEFIYGESYYQE